MKITPVILAGGYGERLWPLSRRDLPKPFLFLAGRSTSLFQDTILRVRDSALFAAPILVINRLHVELARTQLRAIGVEDAVVIAEPLSRNTGPSVALAALYTSKREQPGALLVLPADHVVADPAAFAQAVTAALPVAEAGHVVTFAAACDAYAPGYGYIRYGAALAEHPPLRRIDRFVEKPDPVRFAQLCAGGEAGINCGMFLLTAETALAEFSRHASQMLRYCRAAYAAGVHQHHQFLPDAAPLQACDALSFDQAVMEHTTQGMVVPVAMGWADLGSVEALAQLMPQDKAGNHVQGSVHVRDTAGALVYSDGPTITMLGLTDVAVVAAQGAVLVAQKDQLGSLKQLLAQLPQAAHYCPSVTHLPAVAIERPWGCFHLLDQGPFYQVKRLHVKPGGKISLQSHTQRSEHWYVLSGQATVTCDGQVYLLAPNGSIVIPAGVVHRLENFEAQELVVIEVQHGEYLGEDDILRLEDDYDRV